MSADRYEIFDEGSQIRILYSGSISTIISGPLGTHIEDAVIGAIRQQARDLEQLRAELAAAVAITAARDETIAELELRLRISRQSNKELREAAERAEARLAAIDNAPTVAVVCSSHSFGKFVQQRFFGSQLPRIGTELIARPAKD